MLLPISGFSQTGQWTWENGSDIAADRFAIYGTQGTADINNMPGLRNRSISWIDASGDLWLFGGWGYDGTGNSGYLNDLWKYDGTNWTWVSGSNIEDQPGTYGTQGIADANNIPGARYGSISWIDTSGDLWLFGGYGFDGAGTVEYLNDLWKYDGTNWTWVSGSNTVNQSGTYGIQGTADGNNIPGARYASISWIDASDDLWLFGGWGYDDFGSIEQLNDLWKYDGTNWTWVSGSNTVNQSGTYGTKGVANSSNIPGARNDAISWIDVSGYMWLFGGNGYDGGGSKNLLNDLWKYDGTNWTWVSGSTTGAQTGTYGTQGVADINNVPGVRYRAISWIDSSGDLWLFGGYGYDSNADGSYGYLNDLWKFDGANWTWISGSNTADQKGTYGTQGIADANNIPGARYASISWIDASGDLWLFGGYGYFSGGNLNRLNDLLKYDGTNWTWVSGSNKAGQPGIYGTKGIADPGNLPGARYRAISWTDASNNLWLFGGDGYDSSGNRGFLNDLWKYDGANWTWLNGSNTVNQAGTYGTKGVPDGNNIPGARNDVISWIDTSGNLWLFGGYSFDGAGTAVYFNDLWKYDGTNWTWVSGSNTVNQSGIYGTQGVADANNIPGARERSIGWINSSGDLWLFGGWGYDGVGSEEQLNDLWKYDGTNWTWVSGSNTIDQPATYGTKGVANANNIPGARTGTISWIDTADNLWLFGGLSYNGTDSEFLNDLWKYDGINWTWVSGSNTVNQLGIYGTKGIADASNVPGARENTISWIDASGKFWLFGGYGYDAVGTNALLNDLWKYDGTNWIWVTGRDIEGQQGTYGTQGIADANNLPGARYGAINWIDTLGKLWLFGGVGYDGTGINGFLNDLWEYQLSVETDILTFTLLEQTTPATISAINHTVNIEVISDTDLTTLVPTFTLSVGASAMVSVVEQVSGTSANDFTLPVTYTITAEDGIISEDWVVTVTTANCTPLPSATVIGGGSVCSGNPAPDIVWTLTGTQPYSFTITIPVGGPIVVPSHMSNTYTIAAPTDGGNYEMTDLQDNNSCSATSLGGVATVTVLATAPPTIDAFTPGADVCDDGAATAAPTLILDLGPNSVQSYDITFDIYNSVPSLIGNQTMSKVTDAAGITSIDLDYVADLGQNPDTYEIEIKAIVNTGTGCSAAGLPASQFITINPCPPNGTDFLTFSLPEQTGLATINTVNHTLNIEVAYGTFVTSLIPTFTLSTGSSATASAIAQISGITANDFTNPVTYIITAEDGITTQPWEVSVSIQEDLANPEISAYALPTIIQSGSGGEQASVTVTDNAGLSSVTFYSKRSNASTFSSQEVNSSNDNYGVNITEGMVTDVGLEYFFLAEDTNVNDASTDTVQIVIQYNAENGPTIPNLSAGGAAKNWRMFSIPFVLDDKKVSTHFEVPLGTYDDTKWRIVHYKNDTERFVEYKNGLSIVERGKGYWFNSVQPATIPMSPSKAPSNTKDNLATLTLVAGWNQVGNPYAFDVSWSDVLSHNGITNEVESNLRVFENGTSLTNSTVLKAFGGAYLKANQAIPLEIPMVANSGGRLADINDFDKGWLLSLNLEAGIFINTVSGLGMHPEALLGNDRFDQIRIPRFARHIDATFDHPEYFMPNFSRDIVPEQENYTWEFTISTNIDNEVRVISWNTLELIGDQKLVLIDQVNGNVIDMQVNSQYSYSTSKTRKFKVVCGDEAYLLEQFEGNNVYLGNNYPNPFSERTIIPFSVHGKGSAFKVQMNIYSINGTLVKTLVNKTMPSGIYTAEWNGEANGGNSLSGLFIYSLEVQTAQGVQSFRKKMIVQ